MSDRENVVRVPFTIYLDNPEHEKVYSILEKQKNKSAFLRSAILAYYAQGENGLSAGDVRRIVKECNDELAETLLVKLAGNDKSGQKKTVSGDVADVPEPSGETKKPIDFERLKNLF